MTAKSSSSSLLFLVFLGLVAVAQAQVRCFVPGCLACITETECAPDQCAGPEYEYNADTGLCGE
jgi:hypothetical protein